MAKKSTKDNYLGKKKDNQDILKKEDIEKKFKMKFKTCE